MFLNFKAFFSLFKRRRHSVTPTPESRHIPELSGTKIKRPRTTEYYSNSTREFVKMAFLTLESNRKRGLDADSDHLFFLFSPKHERIELWLSPYSNGNRCDQIHSHLICVFPETDWEYVWPIIIKTLQEPGMDENSSLYQRIEIISHPEARSPNVDPMLAETMIAWRIDYPSQRPALVSVPSPHSHRRTKSSGPNSSRSRLRLVKK